MHGKGQAAVVYGLLRVAVLLAVISTGTEIAWLSCYSTFSPQESFQKDKVSNT